MNLRVKKIIAREFLLLIAVAVAGGMVYGGLHLYDRFQRGKIETLKARNVELDAEIGVAEIPVQRKIEAQTALFQELETAKLTFGQMNTAYLRNYFQENVLPEKPDAVFETWIHSTLQDREYRGQMFQTVRPGMDFFTWESRTFGIQLLGADYTAYFSGIRNPAQLWKRLQGITAADSTAYLWTQVWKADLKGCMQRQQIRTPEQFDTFVQQHTVDEADSARLAESKPLTAERDQHLQELKSRAAKLMSRGEIEDYCLMTVVLLLVLLFPARFLFLGIRWSIRTLRQTES